MAFAGVDGGSAQVVDRVVAEVDGQVLTLSQLEFEAGVLLISQGVSDAAAGALEREALRRSLEAVIDQRLVVREADKLDAYPLEPGELEEAVRAFRTRFANDAAYQRFLDRHQVEVADLAQVLRRALRTRRALEGKLRLKAQVTEGEAREYAARHPEVASQPFEALRKRLDRERFQALVQEALAQLRRQVDVRLLGPFAPEVRQGE